MGYGRVRALLGSHERTRVEETDFLVDTGAYYTALPPKLTESLAIKPVAKVELMVADKRKAEAQLSYAYIKIGKREGVLPVAIMETPEPSKPKQSENLSLRNTSSKNQQTCL
jgi:predicted aspartyl protease